MKPTSTIVLLNQATKDWHSGTVTLSSAKGLSERFFALLRMTRLVGCIGKCPNVVRFDLVLCTLLVFASASLAAQIVLDFDTAEVGKLPADFSIALTGGGELAAWVVQEDPTAPSGNKVLAQTSADRTSYRFPLCVYEKVTARDVRVSVKFKPVSGKVDQAAGIVWRYRDKDNYYIVRANALENNVVLYKVESGKRTDLKPSGAGLFAYGKKASVPQGQWSELRLTATGKRFEVALNGEHLFTVEDETFTQPGKVGLWTKADSVTYFDNLTIESQDIGATQ